MSNTHQHQSQEFRSADSVRAVLRVRTIGSSGLNPPQTEVIDRLQTLSEEDGPLDDLDVDVWGTSIGITHDRDPVSTRETVAEFMQWADAYGYTLQPAFEWQSADSADTGNGLTGQVVTPVLTLAVYTEERLQAVYPYGDGEQIHTIHEGVEALASMAETGDTKQSEDEQSKKRPIPH